MNVAALFLRALDNRPYLPYIFIGEWNANDKLIVEAAIKPNVPGGSVDAMFNQWQFNCYGNWYSATRVTWDIGILAANSASELAQKINEYHQKQKGE